MLSTGAVFRHPVGVAIFVIAAAASACIEAPRVPSQGGHAWFEISTEHFVLHTDLDEDAARSAARDFEVAYLNLEQVAFPGYEHFGEGMDIILLRSAGEFHHFWPRDMAGFYLDRPPQDLERAPTMVLYGNLDGEARVVFLHELTHRFIARAYGWAPVWLNEGLADYFSTMRVEGGRAILGAVPAGRLIEPSLVPSVRELVTADHAAFYGAWTGEDYGDLHRTSYYAGAYALVHLLRNGPDEQRRRFDAFVDAMNNGARADVAWASTIGVVPGDSLERIFRSHLSEWQDWDLFGARVEPLPIPAMRQARSMSDTEIHLLWARLVRASGEDAKEVRAQLDDARAGDPASPEVAYVRGCFALADHRAGEALALFESALASEGSNPRYLYAAMEARLRGGDRSDAGVDLLDRLSRVAKSADQLGAVALYLDARRARRRHAPRGGRGCG